METMITSSPVKEIAEKGVRCDTVECVTLGSKEGNESASVDLNLLESGLEDEGKLSDTCQLNVSVSNSPQKEAMDSESRSDIVERECMVGFGDGIKIVSGDEKMKSLDDSETSSDDNTSKEKMKAEKTTVILQEMCEKEATDDSNAVDKIDEGAIGIKKCKRGRKKKIIKSSACVRDKIPKEVKDDTDGVKVTGRLLRSRTKTMSGSTKVDESRLNESLVGFKRQMEAECFDQTELLKEVNESSHLASSPQKKQKRLGRPPKMHGDAGQSKVEDECFGQTEIQKEANERSQLADRPQKKQKRRGRPSKMDGEAGLSKMEDECFGQIEIQKAANESSQLADRPQKKQKRRGRPPKIQGEIGLRKMKDECFDQNKTQKEVSARSQLAGIPQNKQKRRGRPPKMQSKTGLRKKMKDDCFDLVDIQKEVNESGQLTGRQQKKTQTKNHKDTVINNFKDCGRPPKSQAVNLSTKTEQPDNNLLKAEDVKEAPKIHHVEIQDQESDFTGDKKQKVKISEEINDHTTSEEIVKGDNTTQLNNISGGQRQRQQFVRDQIVSMIMKAGWTIERRPRQGRKYLDAVYVDQQGRTNWSVTKAYFSLKQKIEEGDADTKEISAFTPIPVEEMNILFRIVSKIRSDKDKKKNNKGKNTRKAEIVISGEAPSKKTSNKKGKDGKKRKEFHKSAVKLAKKLSIVKVKKDKSGNGHGVIAESAVQRPQVSKKGGQSRKPCLVARSSGKGLDQDNGDCAMYNGKRNIFSWMIDSGVILRGGKLTYGEGRRRNKFLEGQVTGDGIHCSCCNEILDISNFVSHSGGKLDQALKNISYQSGASLLTCLLESWRKEVRRTDIKFNHVDIKGDDPNDDTCNICGDGGDLICCDGCPSTFHQSCLDIQNFPSGDWHCIYCCCKFCGLVACGASNHAPTSQMITCCLCEEKFHHSCLQEDLVDVGSSSLSFCERKCQELYEQLQTYTGVKFELKDGYSWTLLKCYDLSQYPDDLMKVECNSKLAVAFSVMDECFVPIIDERSGVNRIHNVVYNCGSNFRRLDYSGFYTAILEKGGELISAASIRIHGNRLAEMPFIGTRNMYRRQGMCRRLLDAIEDALCSLGVDELVIPAIPELYKTWTEVFGFKPLEEPLKQAMKGMSLIVFPGTDILRKPLIKNQYADKNLSPVAGDKAIERITMEIDDNTLPSEQTLATHLESETPTTSFQKSEIQFLPSDNEHTSGGLVKNDVAGVKMPVLTFETIPKNNFDLNLQPAATDIDIQSIDEEPISRDPQVCKSSFELSDSMGAQVDTTATQPLVLV